MELQSPSHQSLVVTLPAHLFDQLHPDWKEVLQPYSGSISKIERSLLGVDISPEFSNIFRSLTRSIDSTSVVIFGQDPYPTKGHAHGLAFSVEASVSPLPPSLRNIYKELYSDLAIVRTLGDLSDWQEQGVMLINRILSTDIGQSMAHSKSGWQEVTEAFAQALGKRNVIAVLWGNTALELNKHFSPEDVVSSVHPSPLSAHRGFFGSSPFSQVNAKLVAKGCKEIIW